MSRSRFLLLTAMIAVTSLASSVQATTVISTVIEDYWLFNETNRNEHILNNTGANRNRWSAARFDTSILSAQPFTNPALWQLNSATLTLFEQAGRNGNNGTLSGRVGAAFYDTATNSGWSGPTGNTWSGNSNGRPGRVGGTGSTPGANNIDERSNGPADLLVGLASPANAGDGTSWVNHTFDTANSNETATIDLTNGGASLADIQSILADWVAGSNAGLLLAGEFGNQSFWQSNGVASGSSVDSTIDGDATASGTSLEAGTSVEDGGLFLTLDFTPVPEPSSFALFAVAGLGLLTARRRRS